jgi:hypothetical protein
MLMAYDVVNSPFAACVLGTFIPLRWTIYRAVGASEPLFMSFAFLALTLLRFGKRGGVCVFSILACWTRIDGLSVAGVCALTFLLRGDIPAVSTVGLAGASALGALGLFHAWRFGDPLAYFTAGLAAGARS